MTYKCEYFKIHELVDKDTFERYGERAWMFLDERLLMVIDHFREVHGSATINNYFWKGNYNESGLRSPQSEVGARYSQHRFGRAVDLKFKNITADKFRVWLKNNWNKEYIRFHFGFNVSLTVENKVSWVHLDVRNSENILNFFNP